MKRKQQGYKRIKHGMWATRGEWIPTYVVEQQKQTGEEYQHYAYDACNKLVCAGVTRHERMNQAVANQVARVWRRWRKEYVERYPGSYPTATAGSIAKLMMFPVDSPNQGEWFHVQVTQ